MGEVEPLPWKTIPAMLRDVAGRYSGHDALVDGDVKLRFSELLAQSARVARALDTLGVGPGDRVAVWASNGWRWVVAACGIWEIGAVIVPLSTRWKPPEVAPLLLRTEARLLFSESRAAGMPLLAPLAAHCGAGDAGRPLARLPALENVVAFGEVPVEIPGTLGFDAFLARGAGGPPPAPEGLGPDSLAEVLFTSGTTGTPKGVQLGHRQLLDSYWAWSGIGGLCAGDRFLVIPPYSHGFGINGGILACLMRGVTNVPVATFDPQGALDLVVRERISITSGPPNLFATLMNLESFDPAEVAALRVAFIGAATVPTEIIHRMQERMGIERVCNAYGLIESCVISMTRADDPPAVISTSTGRAMPGVEVRTVAPDGVDVPVGERGEIWVRSAGVMGGYWRDPEQTAAAITPRGFLRTGDIGVMDAGGNIRVVDRLKDMYKCGGFSAYPAEIENQLLERPEVAAVAVVGVPDERLGEVGHAFVVEAAGRRIDVAALRVWARENMANYKVPRGIHVVGELPLNASGKVRKDALRRKATALIGT